MSYDVELLEPVSKKTIQFDSKHHMTGGTYCLGGTTEAWLNITYNYAKPYSKAVEGFSINNLEGKTALETMPQIQEVIDNLGDEVDDDYWKPTEGNAKKALIQLLALAKMRPDGIWHIT